MVKLTAILFIIIVISIQFAQPKPLDDENWESKLKAKQNVWESSGKFEGDIILPILDKIRPLDRNVALDKDRYWPNNELPYEISTGFSENDKNIIMQSLMYLANNTCVKPIPWRDSDKAGLYFSEKPGHGCSTLVGFWNEKQTLNLDVGIGCVQFGVILHEILHALGLWHQQSAHNRDEYIDIKWENIKPGMEYNFDKVTGNVGNLGYRYDYDSIMHYSAYAFSSNGERTIESKLQGRDLNMGQRDGMSGIDLAKIKTMYNCV